MMPVGDEHGLAVQHRSRLLNRLQVGDDPHAVNDAEMIAALQRRLPIGDLLEDLLRLVVGIGIETKYLAEVRLARRRQFQPVRLSGGMRLFVREDVPFAEALHAHPAHEAAANECLPGVLELLVIDVERRIGLELQHPFAPPVLEEPRRARVPVVVLVVAWLVAIELQADHVGGVTLVQFILQGRINHVVGRRDHIAKRADLGEVIANAAKSVNFRHEEDSCVMAI